jgi:hypothetical protein
MEVDVIVSMEPCIRFAHQELPVLIWNQEVPHYYSNSPPDTILSCMNPVYILIFYF